MEWTALSFWGRSSAEVGGRVRWLEELEELDGLPIYSSSEALSLNALRMALTLSLSVILSFFVSFSMPLFEQYAWDMCGENSK